MSLMSNSLLSSVAWWSSVSTSGSISSISSKCMIASIFIPV